MYMYIIQHTGHLSMLAFLSTYVHTHTKALHTRSNCLSKGQQKGNKREAEST